MKRLTDEQRNDDLVKSLLDSGFSEEVVADWIASGAIELSKSVDDDDDDDDEDPENNPAGDGSDHEKGKDGEGEDDDKDLEKGCDDKKKSEDNDGLAKSLSFELMKSLDKKIHEEVGASSEEILKSLPSVFEEILNPFKEKFEKIEKSLDGFRKAIELFGNQAPSFKSNGINLPFLEKSVGIQKDDDDKTILSVSRNREIVRAIISKSIEEEKDSEIKKSLIENTNAYMLDPVEGAIGESAAHYFYEKKNIRLVD